jgi:hypothetical protein
MQARKTIFIFFRAMYAILAMKIALSGSKNAIKAVFIALTAIYAYLAI